MAEVLSSGKTASAAVAAGNAYLERSGMALRFEAMEAKKVRMFACAKVPVASVLCLIGLTGSTVGTQDDGTHNLAVLREFVLAAIDDLQGHNYKVSVSFETDLDKSWTALSTGSVSVHRYDPGAGTRTRVLAGTFWLVGSRVRQASFEGDAVGSPLSKEIVAAVRRRKGWTSEEMTNAFARAGARYVTHSPEEFLRAVDLKRFEPSLGRVVNAKATLITDLPNIPEVDKFEFIPIWLVNLETTTAPGIGWCYYLSFEPFDADLVKLEERPCL